MNDVTKTVLAIGGVVTLVVGGISGVLLVPRVAVRAEVPHMTGEQCIDHCKPLTVRSLDREKGCTCMPGVEINLATQTCDRFCGGKPAKWLVSADMGFLCTCDYLPNVGVVTVPTPKKRGP